MKTNKLIFVGAAALLGVAANASAQITNTDHNFGSYGWSNHEICKPCHTPHFASSIYYRLWNHDLTTATYQTLEGSATAEVDFDIATRLCMSCHDGTVALDSFGGNHGGTNYVPDGKKLGTDLRDDHPVGSEAMYPPDPKPTWWDTAMKATPTGLSLKNWTAPNTTVYKVVGCTTCHTPHGKTGVASLLQKTNDQSGLCLSCHIK